MFASGTSTASANEAPIIHLLVVDDDIRLRELLQQYLSAQGFLVTCAEHAKDARVKLSYFHYDLIVLDRMMPGETGVEFAAKFRQEQETPILMLTAMGASEDRISGLEAGVDDYLPKPFEPRELVLRINSILQRTRRQTEEVKTIRLGDFRFDPRRKQLFKGDQPVHLTTTEADLLGVLAQQLGLAVSRQELSRQLLGEGGNERSVDVQITRLRRKIESDSTRPVIIQTVRGEGYRLQEY